MSHFSAGTSIRVFNGKPECLVIRYLEAGRHHGGLRPPPFRKKFPGGDAVLTENPPETFLREAQEEIAGRRFKILSLSEFHRSSGEFDHSKHFYVFEYQGETRKSDLREDDGAQLWPPYFEDVRDLYRDPSFPRAHKEALRSLILLEAHTHPEFAFAAYQLGLHEAPTPNMDRASAAG